MAIHDAYGFDNGLKFSFETLVTYHKENQPVIGPATVMAHYNNDLTEAFFQKLEEKLAATLPPANPSNCHGQHVILRPPTEGF